MKELTNVVAADITEKNQAGDRARFTAYVQGMKEIERKAQMEKGGKKA